MLNHTQKSGARRRLVLFVFSLITSQFSLLALQSCTPEPPLHLYDAQEATMDLPLIDMDLEVYWDYEMDFGVEYHWEAEWYYGWDANDIEMFGEIGYTVPTIFQVRRYYTGETPLAPHTGVIIDSIHGTHYQGLYDFGYWDLLLWNEIQTRDNVQSIIIDEDASLDSVTAYTNQSMHSSRYNAPRYTHAFYEPEPLFTAYEQAIEINRSLDGFVYDEERNIWVRTLKMVLKPITYIYLTQVILHNNNGRISSIDGTADLSGMARSTTLNTGRAGNDAVTVYFNANLKKGCKKGDEIVDIVGGRLLTFGICGNEANNLSRASEVRDAHRHYMDFTMQFNNGIDSTFVFDVTDQIREKYKGGVITVELDMDTVPIPSRSGGSGFDAVVKDFEDGGTHEFEM
jgi:hypothetical protein